MTGDYTPYYWQCWLDLLRTEIQNIWKGKVSWPLVMFVYSLLAWWLVWIDLTTLIVYGREHSASRSYWSTWILNFIYSIFLFHILINSAVFIFTRFLSQKKVNLNTRGERKCQHCLIFQRSPVKWRGSTWRTFLFELGLSTTMGSVSLRMFLLQTVRLHFKANSVCISWSYDITFQSSLLELLDMQMKLWQLPVHQSY